MSSLVFDAWAILALLQGEEPAAAAVKETLQQAYEQQVTIYLSVINVGEVFYQVGRRKGQEEARATLETVLALPVTVLPASDQRVFAAATLRMQHAISYADSFAAAATQEFNATLVTGDPELTSLSNTIRILMLSRDSR